MWIIGCDCHPGFQQIAFVDIQTQGSQGNGDRSIAKKRRSSIAIWQHKEGRRGWGWKAVDMRAGLNGSARWFGRPLARNLTRLRQEG
jgi:hypothetical protein